MFKGGQCNGVMCFRKGKYSSIKQIVVHVTIHSIFKTKHGLIKAIIVFSFSNQKQQY